MFNLGEVDSAPHRCKEWIDFSEPNGVGTGRDMDEVGSKSRPAAYASKSRVTRCPNSLVTRLRRLWLLTLHTLFKLCSYHCGNRRCACEVLEQCQWHVTRWLALEA